MNPGGYPNYPPQGSPGYSPQGQTGYPPQAQQGYPPQAQPGYPPQAQPGYPPMAQPSYTQAQQGYSSMPQSYPQAGAMPTYQSMPASQPYPGTTAPGQPYSGTPPPAQPYPGTPPPGQPYSGTPSPAQPYPGTPLPGGYAAAPVNERGYGTPPPGQQPGYPQGQQAGYGSPQGYAPGYAATAPQVQGHPGYSSPVPGAQPTYPPAVSGTYSNPTVTPYPQNPGGVTAAFQNMSMNAPITEVHLQGTLKVKVVEASDLPIGDRTTSDPYIIFKDLKRELAKTSCKKKTLNPVWNETFTFDVTKDSEIRIMIYDKDITSDDVLCKATLTYDELKRKGRSSDWMNLQKHNGKGGYNAKLKLDWEFIETHGESNSHEVPSVYNTLQRGCHVTLYQDAHSPLELNPGLKGTTIPGNTCWMDINAALTGATKCIYIAGWSVYTEITLVRQEGVQTNTLGQFLLSKAADGVEVIVMVWDEVFSTDLKVIKLGGVMQTHDNETQDYFRGTKVKVVMASRESDDSSGVKGKLSVGAVFTHHQKLVVCDSPAFADPDKKRLVGFMGGLDLCDGRYDTPQHCIFKTLKTAAHKDDFKQFIPSITQENGPREPWHDIHCKLEGPVVHDLLANFNERLQKQGKIRGDTLCNQICNNSSLGFLTKEQDIVAQGPNTWEAQLFRSIDERSAVFDDKRKASLATWKGRLMDASILKAYVYQIRRAKRFIYIENQYFMGACSHWAKYNDNGCTQPIPEEIVSKIVSKINQNEEFCVYILVPMYPEGVPEEMAQQEMLHWQFRTVEYMYKEIGEALREKNLLGQKSVKDYLNFFCLGNREPNTPDPNGYVKLSKMEQVFNESKRFMIYVHSKMMIVDDEYIIIGSANINQRSMDGARDSEIAVGCHQPNFVASNVATPQAAVHQLRISLWAEHFNTFTPEFLNPASTACVQKVRHLADQNWTAYTARKPTEMPGHIMTYPYEISDSGFVQRTNSQFECFPDSKAKITGKTTTFPTKLPSMLTT